MDPLALRWLRLIAAGSPLVAVAAVASMNFGCGPCDPSVTRHHISEAMRATIVRSDGTVDRTACEAECRRDDVQFADASAMPSGFALGECEVDDTPLPQIVCTWEQYCPGGRAPSAAMRPIAPCETIGEILAALAHREAMSVLAFEELADALAAHAAPAHLVRDARRNAADERRHATAMQTLATRFGATVVWASVPPKAATPLDDLLRLNATEGCVSEAYGAFVAAHQAAHASDPGVRGAFAAIARDEARHALYSFELHAYARTRLPEAAFDALENARLEAAGALRDALAVPLDEASRQVLGLPDASGARRLASVLVS